MLIFRSLMVSLMLSRGKFLGKKECEKQPGLFCTHAVAFPPIFSANQHNLSTDSPEVLRCGRLVLETHYVLKKAK